MAVSFLERSPLMKPAKLPDRSTNRLRLVVISALE
jgi:hypothetical protein